MNQSRQLRMSKLALGLVVALAAAPSFAQSTSAGVGGVVTGSDGAPVTGAEVTITHVESGTVSRTTTDANGRYNARGLRVGGPYTITVVKAGEGADTEDNVFLALNQVGTVDAQLRGDMTTLETVTAVAVAGGSDIFSASKVGAGTNVSREQIEALPSIKRDLQDYARLDPRISQTDKERGEISAGGQNTRYNSITIDRVSTNDTFGLESNNLPTLRQPVSIDAIEEVQINIVNYDVTQKGYTGANINAITKSGTNDFSGSAYYIFRDKDLVGDDENGNAFTGFDDEVTYGGTFGGPLIKDRLFFFLNYEKTEISSPSPDFGPIGSGATNIVNITQAQIQAVQDRATALGFVPGGLTASGLETSIESYLAKVDWNITDTQRASFRFSQTEQNELILPGFGNNNLSLSSHWYSQVKQFDNYSAELFSDWTDNFSTEASVSYRDYVSAPALFARQPLVSILFPVAGRTNTLRLGTEQFRHANALETDTFSAYFAGNLYLGDHTVKFGADYESNDIFNLFAESSLGVYTYNSLADFQNGVVRDYTLRATPSGDVNDAAASFTLNNLGLFIQDTWAFNNNLTLTMGVRYDEPLIDDRPTFNQLASNTFGLRNDATIDGNGLLQPRFGFNYTFDSDRPTQLRGGVGLFQGAAANVWMSNPFTNNGLAIQVFNCGGSSGVSCAGLAASSDPDNQPRPTAVQPAADVDLLDPDLEQPSVWKANLAIDHELPWWGLVASAELLLTQVDTGIYYEHLNLGAPTGIGQDGRNLYYGDIAPGRFSGTGFNPTARANRNRAFNDVLLAKPTDQGKGENLTVSLTKPMNAESNWFWQAAYSYTEATEVNPLTSSRAISNWNGRMIYNPNEDVAARSSYVTRDRFTAATTYRHNFFSDYKTEFALFYEGRKGKPYSWTYTNDMNGDRIAGNDLFYVPGAPGEVAFVSAQDETDFFNYLANTPELASFRGTVADRNGAFSPWVNSFDVRVSQELPGFFGENKAEIWLDILNVGNLINKDWGHIDEIGFPLNRSVVAFRGVNANGQYVYDFVGDEEFRRRDRSAESRWALQVGFRYKF